MQHATSFSLILITELIGLKTTNSLNSWPYLFSACSCSCAFHVSPLCCPSSHRLPFLFFIATFFTSCKLFAIIFKGGSHISCKTIAWGVAPLHIGIRPNGYVYKDMHVAELQGFTVICLVTMCAQGLPAFSATETSVRGFSSWLHNTAFTISIQLQGSNWVWVCVCVCACYILGIGGRKTAEDIFTFLFLSVLLCVSQMTTEMCEKVQTLSGTLWQN